MFGQRVTYGNTGLRAYLELSHGEVQVISSLRARVRGAHKNIDCTSHRRVNRIAGQGVVAEEKETCTGWVGLMVCVRQLAGLRGASRRATGQKDVHLVLSGSGESKREEDQGKGCRWHKDKRWLHLPLPPTRSHRLPLWLRSLRPPTTDMMTDNLGHCSPASASPSAFIARYL